MTAGPNLKLRGTNRLLAEWAQLMTELRRRGAIRSENNPTGDLAEALIAEHYGVKPAPNSTPGYDLKLRNGTRIQVKGRRRTVRSKPSHYGVMRKLDQDPFDALVVVNFDEVFAVESAYRLSMGAVMRIAKYSSHTNGWRLHIMRDDRVHGQGIKKLDLRPET